MNSNGWIQSKVGELCETVSVTHSFNKAQLIFLNTSDILNGNVLHCNYSDVKYMPGQAKKTICINDILFSEIRPANGRWAFIDFESEDYVVSTKLMVIRANDKIRPKYLYKYLTSPSVTSWLQHLAESRSGTFPQITFQQVADLDILLPSLSEQALIEAFISSLDDNIELNRKMNETLEAMARAIYKSWFLDFDPVKAKAEGKKPYGMDEETAALFPSEFEDSELGKIPKGWRVKQFTEVFEINPPRFLRKGEVATYLDMANMPTNSFRAIEVKVREYNSGSRFANDDTLFARITPCLENGKTALVDFLKDGQIGWGSTEFIVIKPKSPFPPEFGYLMARSEDFRAFTISNMTGTSGRQRVPASCFNHYKIVEPKSEVLTCFSKLIKPLFLKTKENDTQSQSIRDIRDSLLPKLLSGKININDVEIDAGSSI